MTYIILIPVLIILLFLKGFFSGSEIALVSADKIRMHHRARSGERGAGLLLRMFKKPDKLLTITLVGTNLSTVALASMGTILMSGIFGDEGDFYAFVFFTPFLLIFGEIVPKSIYQQKADTIAPIVIHPLRWVYFLLFPVIFVFSQVAHLFTSLAGAGKSAQSVFLTREQLRAVLEMTERRSDRGSYSRGRIRRAIRFGDTQALEAMIPLRDLSLIDSENITEKSVQLVRKHGFRPIPIYKDSATNITGVLSIAPWDLMHGDSETESYSGFIHTPFYAAPQQTLAQLLPVLRKREDQTAIIVDEFGSAVGMLTLEDILGAVVGEVKPGFYFEAHPYKRKRTFEAIGDGAYLLDARLSVPEVNDVLGLNLSGVNYRTIGGMVTDHLRHIPGPGEYVVDSGYRFTVEDASNKAVIKVKAEPEV